MSEEILAVVALNRIAATGRTTVLTVKLTRGDAAARGELDRMIGVVAGTIPGIHAIDRGETWASVEWEDGLCYFFSIEKASWVKEATPA